MFSHPINQVGCADHLTPAELTKQITATANDATPTTKQTAWINPNVCNDSGTTLSRVVHTFFLGSPSCANSTAERMVADATTSAITNDPAVRIKASCATGDQEALFSTLKSEAITAKAPTSTVAIHFVQSTISLRASMSRCSPSIKTQCTRTNGVVRHSLTARTYTLNRDSAPLVRS